MPPAVAWKLVLAVALVAAISVSLIARAPHRPLSGPELGRLVLCAMALYLVGGLASLTQHRVLAGLLYAAGIFVCALAAWLSRGSDPEGPPGGDEPVDEQPPPEPDGLPTFDWARFETEFRSFTEREQRDPLGVE